MLWRNAIIRLAALGNLQGERGPEPRFETPECIPEGRLAQVPTRRNHLIEKNSCQLNNLSMI